MRVHGSCLGEQGLRPLQPHASPRRSPLSIPDLRPSDGGARGQVVPFLRAQSLAQTEGSGPSPGGHGPPHLSPRVKGA